MTRTLYTLAYPILTSSDREVIDSFRREHDLASRDLVAAHFTLVFANSELDEGSYVAHVEESTSACKPISFHCRYAMLGIDRESDAGYVFLVPDEGFSEISLLHDRLYTGPLAPSLRLDLPFIPHITIGRLESLSAAKALCDRLNAEGVSIAGSLEALTLCARENDRMVDVARVALGR